MPEKYENLRDNAIINRWEFDGIRMGHALLRFDEFTTQSASNDNEYVRLHFGLKGDYQFSYRQLGKAFDLTGGHHNIMYSKGIELEVTNKTLEIETFGVDFPKDSFLALCDDDDPVLSKFLENVVSGTSTILSPNWGTVDSKIQGVIDEILMNPFKSALKNIFLLAKSLELLVLCLDNYQITNGQQFQYIRNQTDREKIMAARDFINARVTAPPSLPEIAREVGLNEFKLKRGFKEVFHSTVFSYLTDRRLNLAKRMLIDTDQTAAEIASKLGYSSPQYFSRQFGKKYGITPNSIRKNP